MCSSQCSDDRSIGIEQRIFADNGGFNPLFCHRRKYTGEFLEFSYRELLKFHLHPIGCDLHLPEVNSKDGIFRVEEECDTCQARQNLLEQLEPFGMDLRLKRGC